MFFVSFHSLVVTLSRLSGICYNVDRGVLEYLKGYVVLGLQEGGPQRAVTSPIGVLQKLVQLPQLGHCQQRW